MKPIPPNRPKKEAVNKDLTVRLNKFLADAGVTSRRKADELIKEGSVRVNGHVVSELGTLIDPRKDQIKVNNKVVKAETHLVYIAFNKPKQVLTSVSDPEGRPVVLDYFPGIKLKIFPVGRLDWDTEGLLLLTNDGDFSQKVTHPKEGIPKTYLAKIEGNPTRKQLGKLLTGVTIIDGRVKALHVEKIKHGKTLSGGKNTKYDWIKIIISEGKNRQIRKMFAKIGCDVLKLQRVAIGDLKLGKMRPGEHRILRSKDLEKVFTVKDPKAASKEGQIFKKKTFRKKSQRKNKFSSTSR